MKKVYIPFMFLTFLVIFYVGMFVINDTRANEEFINTEKKVDIIHDYTELNFVNNVLTIDFSSLDKSLEFVNNYIGLDDTLDVKYNAIITNAIKANNGVKMYDSGKNKVFQFKLPKEEAMKLIGKYEEVNKDVTVKILFNKEIEIEDIDLDKYDLQINREEIVRRNIVKTAVAEDGATGEEFWTWYGYGHRVEWCCVFVSWVAYKNGVLHDKIPKFVWVKKGVDYYREKDQLKFPSEYTPLPGDIIFFNWNDNEVIDHVGFVEKVQGGYVYTVEGNVNYKEVKRRRFPLRSKYIYAYGVPDYSTE